MFAAALVLMIVQLAIATPQGHGRGQGRNTFIEDGPTADIYDDVFSLPDDVDGQPSDLLLTLTSPEVDPLLTHGFKRAPWAPSEMRMDQLLQKLRSHLYKNRDKHSYIPRGSSMDEDYRMRRRGRALGPDDLLDDSIDHPTNADHLLMHATTDARSDRQAAMRSDAAAIAGKQLTARRRSRQHVNEHRTDRGSQQLVSNHKFYPIYVRTDSNDAVVDALARLVMAARNRRSVARRV
jgi:hypothetical protein